MGELSTLAKARRELEELYVGVPDESVNLTFQDLAEVKQNMAHTQAYDQKRKTNNSLCTSATSTVMDTIQETLTPAALNKFPSLDFQRGLQNQQTPSLQVQRSDNSILHAGHHHRHTNHRTEFDERGTAPMMNGPRRNMPAVRHAMEASGLAAYAHDFDDVGDDLSRATTALPNSAVGLARRRPGIPHSNICTVCSTYIYFFRHRCLVCGRVYCRHCVSIGMGEMTEGRKCVECLGRRFSQRPETVSSLPAQASSNSYNFLVANSTIVYNDMPTGFPDGQKARTYIQRAGQIGCCMRYPVTVKMQELKWAEKGPRRNEGERGYAYGRSRMMMSALSGSPIPITSTARAHVHATSGSAPSFVMNSSSYSPYSPSITHHPFPI
ncbi:hypothetical protein RJ641_032669 [Dillenia turbinata]|uniref:FYVE-type domain-containing protein n=1 Tax=Dillenia turbinata TaxID=194707 RepID=A0AAN8ZCP0_9MAGN